MPARLSLLNQSDVVRALALPYYVMYDLNAMAERGQSESSSCISRMDRLAVLGRGDIASAWLYRPQEQVPPFVQDRI